MLLHSVVKYGRNWTSDTLEVDELLLQRRDRHDPFVGIVQVASGLLGLHLARALHQHAGDDLKAVGDPVLKLLKKNRLLLQHIVFEPFGDARLCDIGHRYEKPDVFPIAVFELLGIHDKTARFAALVLEIDLVALDRSIAGRRRFKERRQLRDVPFARSKLPKRRRPASVGRVDLKRVTERLACGDQREIAVEQQQRRSRGGDHRQREIECYVGMRRRLGSHGCPFLENRRLAKRKPYPNISF